MTPVYQTKFGKEGNCLLAAIASFFDLSLEEVPDFYKVPTPAWRYVLTRYFEERFHALFMISIPRDKLESYPFDPIYFVVGPTERGPDMHICLYQDGKLLHDPHPSGVGLLEEVEYWYVLSEKSETYENLTYYFI